MANERQRGMLKRLAALLLTMALCLCAAAAPAEEAETLSVGSKGQAVLEMKRRLQELRYIEDGSLTKKYTDKTAEAVRDFQRLNGLEETGELDPATREALFAETAVKKPRPTMRPLATPAPTPAPDWPERDADGYLAGEGEFFYENDEEGLWIYLSRSLQITIVRREDSAIPLVWFETDILTRNGETFRTALTDPEHPGRQFQYPYVISKNEGFVLGFTDDFFATRMADHETVGIIIRNGEIISEKTNRKTGRHLPTLDMMAQYPDGRLMVYECSEHTAQELLEMGAVNVFSFGPILIRDGEINDTLYTEFRSVEPRQALGMIEPGHYFLLSVQGRTDSSKGTPLQRLAEIMKERGVTQALNLDGGNTMALVFRGRMLNKLAVYKKRKFVRTVTSLIGIGFTENQAD